MKIHEGQTLQLTLALLLATFGVSGIVLATGIGDRLISNVVVTLFYILCLRATIFYWTTRIHIVAVSAVTTCMVCVISMIAAIVIVESWPKLSSFLASPFEALGIRTASADGWFPAVALAWCLSMFLLMALAAACAFLIWTGNKWLVRNR